MTDHRFRVLPLHSRLTAPVATAVLLTALVALGAAPAAHATPLAPGDTILAVGEPDPTGGAVVDFVSVIFSTPTFSGTLTSTVLSGDSSNPDGLTFTYLLENDPTSQNSLGRLTV